VGGPGFLPDAASSSRDRFRSHSIGEGGAGSSSTEPIASEAIEFEPIAFRQTAQVVAEPIVRRCTGPASGVELVEVFPTARYCCFMRPVIRTGTGTGKGSGAPGTDRRENRLTRTS